MMWNLFIDDERDPPKDGREWVVCRSKMQVIAAVYDKGMPSYISFDHDLGEDEETGYDIAKWIVNQELAGSLNIPDDFDFYVHSQNPVGKANIEGYLDGYLKAKERSKQVPFNQHRFDEIAELSECDYDSNITVGNLK